MPREQSAVSPEAKQLYWYNYIPRFLLLVGGIMVVSTIVMTIATGFHNAEIVPVQRDGQVFFALRCEYSSLLRIHDVTIDPVVPDAARLDRKSCPKTYDNAMQVKAKDVGAE